MASPKNTARRVKAPAALHVPGDRDTCASQIRRIGDLQRERERLAADLNDQVAALTDAFQPQLAELDEQIKALSTGVQTWCEAHRDELTQGGKVKFHDFLTGQVTWRTAPPSVRVTNADAVIKTLRLLGLHEFVRTKEEVDKEAVLANFSAAPKITTAQINGETDASAQQALIRTVHAHEALQGLSGLAVVTGKESFAIEPVALAEEPTA